MVKRTNCLICNFNKKRNVRVKSDHWVVGIAIDLNIKGLYFIKSKRHVEHLGELTEKEAKEVGGIIKLFSKISQEKAGAQRIIAMSLGFSEPHVHFWIIPVNNQTEKDLLKISKVVKDFVRKNKKNSRSND